MIRSLLFAALLLPSLASAVTLRPQDRPKPGTRYNTPPQVVQPTLPPIQPKPTPAATVVHAPVTQGIRLMLPSPTGQVCVVYVDGLKYDFTNRIITFGIIPGEAGQIHCDKLPQIFRDGFDQ